MSDWFTTALEMQREILRAQQAQLDATRKLMRGEGGVEELTEANQQAVDVQRVLWEHWVRFWGFM